MKIEFDTPVLVRGRPRTCVRQRTALCLVPVAIDVPELHDADFPVALRVSTPRMLVAMEWRAFDSRLFRRVRSEGGFTVESGLWSHLRYAMADAMKARGSGYPAFWPPYAATQFVRDVGEFWNRHPAVPSQMTRMPRPPETSLPGDIREADGRDIEFWTDRARDYFENALVCGGGLWVEVPEPVFLMFNGRLSSVVDLDWYDAGEAARPVPAPYVSPYGNIGAGREGYWDSRITALPATGVVAGSGSLSTETTLGEGVEVTVLMPDLFGHAQPALELLRRTRAFVADFERGWEGREVPGAILDAIRGLAVVSDTRRGNAVDLDDVERALEAYLDVARPVVVRQGEDYGGRLRLNRFAAGIARALADRPIEISRADSRGVPSP